MLRKTRNLSRQTHLITLVILIGGTWAHSQPFAGGTGEPQDPYQIATAAQLLSLTSNPGLLDRHFLLVADVNLAPTAPGGKALSTAVIAPDVQVSVRSAGWSGSPFEGCLDGGGHRITGLVIRHDQGYSVGLIGVIGTNGRVRNLTVEGECRISGTYSSNVGGLAGENHGWISHCRFHGAVQGRTGVGGLVGSNRGTIVACHSSGTVMGTDGVGGLTGDNLPGIIVASSSRMSVTGTSRIGGLVGNQWGVIAQCCFEGDIQGDIEVGGSTGVNRGVIVASYSSGTAAGNERVGGLVGSGPSGLVVDSYSIMSVTGTRQVGRLVGDGPAALAINCYFLSADGTANGPGTALSDAQMRQRASFAGWDFYGDQSDGRREIWFMPPDGPPVASWQSDLTGLVQVPDIHGLLPDQAEMELTAVGLKRGNIYRDFSESIGAGRVIALSPGRAVAAGETVDMIVSEGRRDWTRGPGNGSPANPYPIVTAGELESIARAPFSHFVLDADLDLSERVYRSAPLFPSGMFLGSLDGRGHTIAGLTVVSTGEYVGLFGNIGANGRVQDVSLRDAWIIGMAAGSPLSWPGGRCGVGILAGESSGSIVGCTTTGRVVGIREVGGLVGKVAVATGLGSSGAAVTECSAHATVYGSGALGGLVGTNQTRITGCYAAGVVTGNETLGGLVGFNEGEISDCYTSGTLWNQNTGLTYGLVGGNRAGAGTCRNSYFLTDPNAPGPARPLCDANGLSDAALRKRESFKGWDFYGSTLDGIEDRWCLPPDGYPVFSWQSERSGLMPIPDVTGQPLEQALAVLRDAGVATGATPSDWDAGVAAGMVITTMPRQYVPVGSPVEVLHSLGAYDWKNNPGQGTATKPYEISTIGQLLATAPPLPLYANWQYLGGRFFVLTADLDLSGRVFTAAPVRTFCDVLDGRDHAISHLTIEADGNDLGLFGSIGSLALVTDLTLQDVRVNGNSSEYVGGLTGRNDGFVQNCHASGAVAGCMAVGGLVGANTGLIAMCHTEGSVTGRSGVRYVTGAWGYTSWRYLDATGLGGLLGMCRRGVVSVCFSTVDVHGESGASNVGGLIGGLGNEEPAIDRRTGKPVTIRYAGTVVDSYATGTVSVDPSPPSPGSGYWPSTPVRTDGTLVGNVILGDIVNCYTLAPPLAGNTSIATASFCRMPPVVPTPYRSDEFPYVVSLTDEEMKRRESFTGWDFESTWTICEGRDYPRLQWEQRECPEPH